jgi:hypothetical protein
MYIPPYLCTPHRAVKFIEKGCSKKLFYCDICLNDHKNAIIFMLFDETTQAQLQAMVCGFLFYHQSCSVG